MNYIDNSKDYLLFLKYLELKELLNTDKDRDKDHWGNVPIGSPSLKVLYDIYEPGKTFLDLGCGAGNVLRFAKNIGYEVTGVEFDRNLTQFLGDYNYLCKDIRELEDIFFNKFDVIYAYKPLKEDEFKLFIDNLKKKMKSGSYLITPYFNQQIEKIR